MDLRFDGRVALVSGGAQGIGRAIAIAFREAGARVHLVDRDSRIKEEGCDLGLPAHVVDLTDRDASAGLVQSVVEQEGRLDILALAAGGLAGLAGLPLEGVTDENWDRIMGANVKSALWLSQAAAPFMTKAGWGRIVIVSSGAGLRPSLTGLYGYTASKHAVIGLTKQLSVGLARHGVTVNSVAGLHPVEPGCPAAVGWMEPGAESPGPVRRQHRSLGPTRRHRKCHTVSR